ncbi:hypothetical protein AMECASPLE_022984 [Ameca splendens]|uniref:CCHC-type domain-containing protein n=1 Tax=Ameca splendens TaxID=208324 RepID=A0ABV0Y4A6_9TELE
MMNTAEVDSGASGLIAPVMPLPTPTWQVHSPQVIPIAPTIVYQLAPPIQWEPHSHGPCGRARDGQFGNRAGGRGGRGGAGCSYCLVCGQMDHWARSCPQRYGACLEGAPPPLYQPLAQQAPFTTQPPNAALIPPQGCQYHVQGWEQQ